MEQSNSAVEDQINDVISALSEGLYTLIAAESQNFDLPTQTFQKRIIKVGFLSNRLLNNKTFLDT